MTADRKRAGMEGLQQQPAKKQKRGELDSSCAQDTRVPCQAAASPETHGRDDCTSNGLPWGMQTTIGMRDYQEDASLVSQLGQNALFGVFDGHGGACVSNFCAQNMADCIAQKLSCASSSSQEATAVQEAFVSLDEQMSQQVQGDQGGSTAVIVLVNEDRILCANCGDSRAVLARTDGSCVALSNDHKPEREDEEERIMQAGGRILYNNGLRVMGVLGMSRAIGDTWLRKYGVIPDPEVQMVQRTPCDEFVIVASDGLWGAMSNEEAVDIARRCIQRARVRGMDKCASTRVAAKVLIRAAMQRGSRDNITVIVADLAGYSPCKEVKEQTGVAASTLLAPMPSAPAATSHTSSSKPGSPAITSGSACVLPSPANRPGSATAVAKVSAYNQPVTSGVPPRGAAAPAAVRAPQPAAAATLTPRRMHSEPSPMRRTELQLVHALSGPFMVLHSSVSGRLLSAERLVVQVRPCPC
eukprot:CAMPEP_0202904626 /NCGR_PEP_ID=MMETSP1392-20130828/30372_1 /ASSEMBLY_ACC=CAM_ASM_000868 /TAXON_ID=225041 /ORGANISM="Chlamydomonas chlamydogama, Strain SAG 11-48b" /LENGTH=469 /DNA_ID=CAMNT_0049592355 /DNA_START=121 /DNA_END=1530 /DNA_ORIENTATION=+